MRLKKVFPIIAMLLIMLMAGCNKKNDFIGVRPKVTSTDPISNATSIAINSKISATFNVDMDPSTITITNFALQQGTTSVSGVAGYTGTTASFTPAANLTPNTVYTATISTGAKDFFGNTLVKDYVWSFTSGATPDLTLPRVTVTDPLNNATGVAINHLVVITFSKTMDQTTITSLNFNLKQGSTTVSGAVTYTGTTATFTPTSTLAYSKIYNGTITTGAKDMQGNALASNYTFSFTTAETQDIILPMVNSTDPLSVATGITRNKAVTSTFSESMDPTTINTSTFILKQGTTAVPGAVTYSGTTATFTPTNVLAANLTYTATITTGAKDLAGNALAANVVWSFTTGGNVAGQTAVVLGTAGNYVILAKTAITNISPSAVTGDLGLSPAAESYITGLALTDATGYSTSAQVTGKIYAADMASPTPINLTTAVNNMITAYNDAAGRSLPDFVELGTGNIGGKTLVPGLYKWTNNVTIPSNITITGSSTDVWIFQIAGNLNMSTGVNVTLSGGALAKNIFWQVAGQATFGTTTHFEGIILSMTGITFQTNASFNGRALAQTAVVLDHNTITQPL